MKRIRLSKEAKQVFRLVCAGVMMRPDYLSESDFNNGARELQQYGLAACHEEENGNVEVVRVTEHGKRYMAYNPSLRNPIDWQGIAIIITAICAVVALFIACKNQ